MKNHLLLLLIGAFFLFSCKKDLSKANEPSGQKFAVNFTLGDLGKATTNSSKLQVNSVADTFRKYIKTLKYLVYDNSGNFVHQINQDSTTTNLGNISDFFPAGTYTIFFWGNAIVSSDYFTPLPANPDVFYQKLNITVTNSVINQQVALNRIVTSQVQIRATDVVPANIESIKVTLNADCATFFTSTLLPYKYELGTPYFPHVISHTFTAAEIGKSNFKISTFFHNIFVPFTVTIERFPKSVFLSPIVINNVTCQLNNVTLLTGNVFGGSVAGGFHISFDPAWNSQIVNF